jgi:hypothetical protein
MALLRMRNASFTREDRSAGPLTLDVWPGQRAALTFASPEEAEVVALLAAGIVKATNGTVLIGDYDPRIQSVHCKRIAAFVPHEPTLLREREFARYIAYRAALWNIDVHDALAQAAQLRERLGDLHEAFAYPLIGALIGGPQIVVLDRPAPAYARQIFGAIGSRAAFSTHVGAAAADAFGRAVQAAAVSHA